jgi:hypothetical protein
MTGKWRVRKWPKCKASSIWEVFEPSGRWCGTFDTWDEAMSWAANPIERIEHWLAHQPKPWMGSGFWGQPADRDDEGHPR